MGTTVSELTPVAPLSLLTSPITMLTKIVLFACLAALAKADKRPTNSYQPPQVNTYQPPQPSYEAPEPTYQAPEKTYEAPRPAYSAPQPSYQSESYEEGMPFAYNWAVDDEYTQNHFHHDTKSDGKVTEGEYRVLLPDGRTQIVKYTSDSYNGFQAEVTYEGEAKAYEPQPSYQPPKNTYA